MGLINCSTKNRNTCGEIISSSCVSFEGKKDNILNKETLPCNSNLDDVIKVLSDSIYNLKKETDLSKIDSKCLSFDKEKENLATLQQVVINQVCVLKTILENLKITVDNLNASNIFATIDLGCLKTNAAGCNTGNNTYSILSLLNLFKNEICILKNN